MYREAPQPHCASNAMRSGLDSCPSAKAMTRGFIAEAPKASAAAELNASGGSSGSPSESSTTAQDRSAAARHLPSCSPDSWRAGTRRVPPPASMASTQAQSVLLFSTPFGPPISIQSQSSDGSLLKPRRDSRSPSPACAMTSLRQSFSTSRTWHIEPERSTTSSTSLPVPCPPSSDGGQASATIHKSSAVSSVRASTWVRHRSAPTAEILGHSKAATASAQSARRCCKRGSKSSCSSLICSRAFSLLLDRSPLSSAKAALKSDSVKAKLEKSPPFIRV
mmetsp:Transcript_7712/g.13679  ORF Transcript_7712/g.13679 Transcript_7712/m.13679 type:complete len:278 (+) Transcript_7712:123-956(+)